MQGKTRHSPENKPARGEKIRIEIGKALTAVSVNGSSGSAVERPRDNPLDLSRGKRLNEVIVDTLKFGNQTVRGIAIGGDDDDDGQFAFVGFFDGFQEFPA